jgi:hypothetical protein
MGKKGGEAALKRAREKTRLEKQDLKRQRRQARSAETAAPAVDTDALMEEFAKIGALYEANRISEARFNEERKRIFEALGIESD